jgi:hypothetical protein
MKGFNCFCLGAFLLVGVVPTAHSACSDYTENYGKVSRIYPQYNSGTYFTLKGGIMNALGGNTYYHISPKETSSEQAIYRSIHDMLMEAAKSGRKVYVETVKNNCQKNTANAA